MTKGAPVHEQELEQHGSHCRCAVDGHSRLRREEDLGVMGGGVDWCPGRADQGL